MGNCLSEERTRQQENGEREKIVQEVSQKPVCIPKVTNNNQHDIFGRKNNQFPSTSKSLATANSEARKIAENPNVVVLSEFPKLIYNKHLMFANHNIVYGGKIFNGTLDNRKVVLKLVKKTQMEEMKNERKILSSLTHPNIANIIYPHEIPDNCFFLVTENLGGPLNIYKLDDYTRKEVMHQLMKVLDYLQSKRISHLEIIPQNVYVSDFTHNLVVKLVNFHKARFLNYSVDTDQVKNLIVGFTSPEVFYSKFVSMWSDIYSLGCVFYYIMTSGLAMAQIQKKDHHYEIMNCIDETIPSDTSTNILFKDMLLKMLEYQPSQRLSTDDGCDHPFFWSPARTVKFIIEISKLTEKDKRFLSYLCTGGSFVVDGNWINKLEPETIRIIKDTRLTHQNKTGSKPEELKGKSILSLVKTIRNLLVHAPSDNLCLIMGEDDEDILNYWSSKFPKLIMHLFKSKCKYEREAHLLKFDLNGNQRSKKNRKKHASKHNGKNPGNGEQRVEVRSDN